jgi:hypothetical protein
MEQTECSETSAYKIQTPGNYPEENIQHTEHGESLKSRNCAMLVNCYKNSAISCERTELSCDYYKRVAEVLELNLLGYSI